MAQLRACLLASLTALAMADIFLAKSDLSREDVKNVLLSELLGRSDAPRLRSLEEELRPMYVALPKDEQGLLEFATVRYALHRHFLKKYGWSVKGLDAAGQSWNAPGTTNVLKARAPAYILSLFEELHGKGMGLHELAVFAATLADLVHAESIGRLEKIYAVLGLPTVGPVDPTLAQSAVNSFVVDYLLHGRSAPETKQDLREMKARLDEEYPNQDETNMWVDDLRQTYALEQRSRRNPFVTHPASFDASSAFVLQFGHSFGSFQNLECHTLKRRLVEMEHEGSGRVLLSTFYSTALGGAWEFMESVEYLRNQGALDESDPKHPSVVIANYRNSRTNCLTASDYYAVCCLNECDALLDRLESKIAAPHAAPARIAEVVSNLQSDTVDAPRNLSAALLSRLDGIAEHHLGRVPLHGRLFAQWMHHAYPRECPFPHIAGAFKPMYPEEFVEANGESLLQASQEDMEMHASRSTDVDMKPMVLPWSHEEELVSEHRHSSGVRGASAVMPALKAVLAMIALVSLAVPMVRTFKVAFASISDSKAEAHLV